MFAPTKIYRRWHRKISKGQRRYATCSALAATAVPSLVMARGHRIGKLAEIPFVVADSPLNKLKKTKQAVELLKKLNAYDDIEKSINSKRIRPGKGKSRGRRYTRHKGPLIIHTKSSSDYMVKAFRNIPGIELVNVSRLNLLTLAPGGHLGRFVIWSESAFRALNSIFGTFSKWSEVKGGFKIPRAVIGNADITKVINSSEVQTALRLKNKRQFNPRKRNPLTNLGAMIKLNPYAITQRRRAIRMNQGIIAAKAKGKKIPKKKKKPSVYQIAKAEKAKAGKAKGEKGKAEKGKAVEGVKKTIEKGKRKGKIVHTTRRASPTWLKVLWAPAIAPPRSRDEITPKYQ